MAEGATLPLSLPTAMTFGPDGNLDGSNLGFGHLRWDLGRYRNYFALTLGAWRLARKKASAIRQGLCRDSGPMLPGDCPHIGSSTFQPVVSSNEKPHVSKARRGALDVDSELGTENFPYVPSLQPARYSSCSGVSRSILIPMDSSFSLATRLSSSSGTL